MTKKSKTKADIVQSTLRLPRALWVRINKLAATKNLSMQQAVQEAIVEYCDRNTTVAGSTFARSGKGYKKVFVQVLKGGK